MLHHEIKRISNQFHGFVFDLDKMLDRFLEEWVILDDQCLASISHYFKEYFQGFIDIFTHLFLLFLYLVVSRLKYLPFNVFFVVITLLF